MGADNNPLRHNVFGANVGREFDTRTEAERRYASAVASVASLAAAGELLSKLEPNTAYSEQYVESTQLIQSLTAQNPSDWGDIDLLPEELEQHYAAQKYNTILELKGETNLALVIKHIADRITSVINSQVFLAKKRQALAKQQ